MEIWPFLVFFSIKCLLKLHSYELQKIKTKRRITANKDFWEDYSLQQEDSIKYTLAHEIQHVVQGLGSGVKGFRAKTFTVKKIKVHEPKK